MDEYIEREAAIESIMSEPTDAHYPSWYADKIKGIPTADVAPVVHGRWKEWWSEEYITYFHKCSVCGQDALTKEETCHDEVLSNYCPNCGARMDGGVE